MQQKTKQECLELQRKLNGLYHERDVLLHDLANVDVKYFLLSFSSTLLIGCRIQKATNDTAELKRQVKSSGPVHN